jgi:hypothetical protein
MFFPCRFQFGAPLNVAGGATFCSGCDTSAAICRNKRDTEGSGGTNWDGGAKIWAESGPLIGEMTREFKTGSRPTSSRPVPPYPAKLSLMRWTACISTREYADGVYLKFPKSSTECTRNGSKGCNDCPAVPPVPLSQSPGNTSGTVRARCRREDAGGTPPKSAVSLV